MRRKLLAVVIMVSMLSSEAYANDWSGYLKFDWDTGFSWEAVSDYASEKWSDTKDYVSSLFAKNDDGKNTSPSTAASQSSNDNLPAPIATDWDKLTGTLVDALTLRDKQDTLPKRSWFPFVETQASNTEKINALLDIALSILVNGEAGEVRKTASAIRESIIQQKTELDELRNKRITAPEKSNLPWKLTKSKADEKIALLQEEIADSEEALATINAKLAEALGKIGLELDAAQTDILLNSVTGDDLMNNTIVFANVKIVVEKLEELAQKDTNTLEITRRYTGMYLVLNDLLIYTQEALVNKIDEDYKPKLKAIINEAEVLRKDALTRSNQGIYTPEQRRGFASNAQSNAMTIRVAKLYIELLNSQRSGTMEGIKSLKLNRDLAENTYKTVRSTGELRGLIHSGLSLFDAVNSLKMPELKVFESGVMRAEFEEINRRLKK